MLTLGETAAEPGKTDHWEIELGPYEATEFKYTLEAGKPMVLRLEGQRPAALRTCMPIPSRAARR